MTAGPRIAHVISARGVIGGAERTLISVAREAERRGWSQLILNPFADAEIATSMERELSGVDYRAIPGASVRDLRRIRREVSSALAEFRPDILHAHLFHALALVASIRRRDEKRVLSHQHGRLLLQRRRYAEASIDWLGGFRYDRIITCSNDVKRFVVSRYGYRSARVVVIYNGWEGRPLDGAPKSDVPTVVCVANLRHEKGHAVLLKAWKHVLDRVPNAVLELVGGGPLEEELHRHAQELALNGSVRFVGPVRDVWPLLARAHVFALPSLHEPFGIVAVEAMAAGLPIVVSEVGGLREFIEQGVNGILVPPGDPVRLASELTALLLDADRRSDLGSAARRHAADFTMDRTVARYADEYEALAFGNGRGPAAKLPAEKA